MAGWVIFHCEKLKGKKKLDERLQSWERELVGKSFRVLAKFKFAFKSIKEDYSSIATRKSM